MYRILTFRLIPLRRSTTVLLFCVFNMLWSYAGGWCFTLGALTEYLGQHVMATAWVGIDSSRGSLTIAERDGGRYRWGIYPHNERLDPDHTYHGWSFKPRFEIPREFPVLWIQPNPFAWPHENSPYVYEGRVVSGAWEPHNRGFFIARKLTLQWWVLCILAGVVPAIRLARWLSGSRRFAHGMCKTCGYDLRATPERCPECGNAMTSAGEVMR